jgi:hypothetical protein
MTPTLPILVLSFLIDSKVYVQSVTAFQLSITFQVLFTQAIQLLIVLDVLISLLKVVIQLFWPLFMKILLLYSGTELCTLHALHS